MELAIAADGNHSGGLQRLDVMGDRGLREWEVLDQLGAVHGTKLSQACDHPPPRGVGECLGDFDKVGVVHGLVGRGYLPGWQWVVAEEAPASSGCR